MACGDMASSVTYLVKVLGAKCQLGEGHEQHQTETVEQHGGQKAHDGLWMQQAEKIRHPRQDKCDSSRGKQATRGGWERVDEVADAWEKCRRQASTTC